MTCNKQMMIRTGIGIGVLLLIGYIALPPFRAFILGLSPILLTLLCPLSMFVMMKGMAGRSHQAPPKEDEPSAKGADSAKREP